MANEHGEMEIINVKSGDLAVYESMLDAIPEVSEGGYEDILLAIANAEDIFALEDPLKSESMANLLDRQLVVQKLKRAVSDYAGGLGTFLIVEGVQVSTGEKFTVTTGSVVQVAQLCKLNAMGALPVVIVPRKKKEPTKNGYYPMHFEIVGKWEPDKKTNLDVDDKDLEDMPF